MSGQKTVRQLAPAFPEHQAGRGGQPAKPQGDHSYSVLLVLLRPSTILQSNPTL